MAQLLYVSNHVEWSHGRPPPLLPSYFKHSQLAEFQVVGPEWKTPRKFHCSLIWEQMLDNVHEHFSFTFLLRSFFWSTPLISYLFIADCSYLFMLINHNITIKTKFCEHSSHFLGYIRNCSEEFYIKNISRSAMVNTLQKLCFKSSIILRIKLSEVSNSAKSSS
jgi:hypothetical protein